MTASTLPGSKDPLGDLFHTQVLGDQRAPLGPAPRTWTSADAPEVSGPVTPAVNSARTAGLDSGLAGGRSRGKGAEQVQKESGSFRTCGGRKPESEASWRMTAPRGGQRPETMAPKEESCCTKPRE